MTKRPKAQRKLNDPRIASMEKAVKPLNAAYCRVIFWKMEITVMCDDGGLRPGVAAATPYHRALIGLDGLLGLWIGLGLFDLGAKLKITDRFARFARFARFRSVYEGGMV